MRRIREGSPLKGIRMKARECAEYGLSSDILNLLI